MSSPSGYNPPEDADGGMGAGEREDMPAVSHGFTEVEASPGDGEMISPTVAGGGNQPAATSPNLGGGGDPGILFSAAAAIMASEEEARSPEAGVANEPPAQPPQPTNTSNEQTGPLSFAAAMIASVPYAEEAVASGSNRGGEVERPPATTPETFSDPIEEQPEDPSQPMAMDIDSKKSELPLMENTTPMGSEPSGGQTTDLQTDIGVETTFQPEPNSAATDPSGGQSVDLQPKIPTEANGPSGGQPAGIQPQMDVETEKPERTSGPVEAMSPDASGEDTQAGPAPEVVMGSTENEAMPAQAMETTMGSDQNRSDFNAAHTDVTTTQEPDKPLLDSTMAPNGGTDSLPTEDTSENLDQSNEEMIPRAEETGEAFEPAIAQTTTPAEPSGVSADQLFDSAVGPDNQQPLSMAEAPATSFAQPEDQKNPTSGAPSQQEAEMAGEEQEPFSDPFADEEEAVAQSALQVNQEATTMEWEANDPFSDSPTPPSAQMQPAEEKNAPSPQLEGPQAPVQAEAMSIDVAGDTAIPPMTNTADIAKRTGPSASTDTGSTLEPIVEAPPPDTAEKMELEKPVAELNVPPSGPNVPAAEVASDLPSSTTLPASELAKAQGGGPEFVLAIPGAETTPAPGLPTGDTKPSAPEPSKPQEMPAVSEGTEHPTLPSPAAGKSESESAKLTVAEQNPAIRFAKDEIVAVYLGAGEPGECEYGFVNLSRDVLYDDYVKADREDIDVNVDIQWYAAIIDEKKRGKNITILYPEPMPDVVPLDSLICAVSHHAVLHVYANGDELLEFSNSSVRPHVEARLKIQLADEYDPAVTARHDDRDELFHEARLARLKEQYTNKKVKGKTTKKRRRSGPTKRKKPSENGHKRGNDKKPSSAGAKAKSEPTKSTKKEPPSSKPAPEPGTTKPSGTARPKPTSAKASSRKNSRKHPKLRVQDYDDSIRFGAEEIVVVYLGEGESEYDCSYGFVKLAVDVLYDDYITAAEDDVDVEWFAGIIDEEKRGPDITILYPEPATDSVPIGSLICAITHQVALHRHEDGTELFEFVNKRVRPRIEEKLKIQLSDDYDPAISARDDDKDEMVYEKRLSILKEKFDKMKKRSRSEKRRSEDEDADYQDEDNVERAPVWKKRKTQQGAVDSSPQNEKKKEEQRPLGKVADGPKKQVKAQLIPRSYVEIEPEIWSNKSGKVGTFCGDTYRASKEVIRAVRTGSTKILLPKLIQDSKKTVADLYVQQSADVPLTSVDYAFVNQDRASLRMLYEASRRSQEGTLPDSEGRVEFPICSLLEQSSGEPVGFEGNNDFLMDNNTAKGNFNLNRDRICELLAGFDAVSVNFVKFVNDTVYPGLFNYNFPIDVLLQTGHRELTEYAMKALQSKGVVLNDLHGAVLGVTGAVTEKFEIASVIKLSAGGNNVRFSPIHCAATNPNPSYLQQLLKVAPRAAELRDSQDGTVLHYSAVSEKPATLQWLLKAYDEKELPRDCNTHDKNETPLFWAARTARAENILLLCRSMSKEKLKKQAKDFNSDGLTVLHTATSSYRSGRLEAVKALLRQPVVDVDVPAETHLMDNITPSMIAARQGDLEMLKILVDVGGADLTAKDRLGRTLAIWASMNGHLHVLSYLLRAGVDIEAQDGSGNTAIHYAAAYGWVECVHLMLKHGATCDPKNRWLSSPLSLSLKRGSYACSAELLSLKDKVDVNIMDHTGRSLFSSWIGTYVSESTEVALHAPLPWPLKRILELDNLDVSSTDSKKRTVLHYVAESRNATKGGMLELVLDLLNRGLDPLLADINGDTAASLALRDGDWELVDTLCAKVSHSNAPFAPGGASLLHLLMERMTDFENAESFFKVYDNVNNGEWESHVDDLGRTPLLLAASELRPFDDLEDPGWLRAKHVFEGLVDRMPSHVGDFLQRKMEYSVWSEVEKLLDAAGGKVNWEPRDEYNAEDCACATIFHVLCSSMDTEWACTMFVKCADLLKGQNVNLKALLNLKLDTSCAPFALLLRNLRERVKTPAQVQGALGLITLLKENGADLDSIPHYMFDSLEEIVTDADVEMGVKLDTGVGSEAAKLEKVREFLVHNQRRILRQKLKEKDTSTSSSFKPYLHQLLDSDWTEAIEMLAPLVNVDKKDMDGNTGIHIAVGNGNGAATHVLIQYGDVNATNSNGITPLMVAAEKGNIAILLDLLKAGAQPNYCSPAAGNSLHAAVRGGHTEILEALLSKCTPSDVVDVVDGEGRTPMHLAVAHKASGDSKQELRPCESQLLAAGANINAKDAHGRTPAFYAFIPLDGDMQCLFPKSLDTSDPIELLLAMLDGVELDVTDVHRRNLMHLAAAAGASTCVLSLSEQEPKLLHSSDMDMNTPLAVALLARHWDTALLLIRQGSLLDVTVTDVNRTLKDKVLIEHSRTKQSALWHAVEGNGALSTYMLSSLGQLPMEVVLKTLFGTGSFRQALTHIQQCHNKEDVCFVGDEDGKTALHHLAQATSFANAPGFDIALADALIECGVAVETVCKRGFTVIHYCAYHGHVELAKHLLKLRGNLADLGDPQSGTPVSSTLSGLSPSSMMLYEILACSSNGSLMANSAVEGGRNRKADETLRSLADPLARMFDTKPEERRSKDSLVSRLGGGNPLPDSAEASTDYKISSTALIEAVRKENLGILNMLLSFGADPSACDAEQRTAYHHAAIVGNTDGLALLLQHSVTSIDAADMHGFTALSYILLSSLDCSDLNSPGLDVLLDYGADPQVGDAMNLAVKHNMKTSFSAMLYRGKNAMEPSTPGLGHSYSDQDIVWVRFGGVRGSWQLATVVGVLGDKVTVVPGTGDIPREERDIRSIATFGVSPDWIRRVDHERDTPSPAKDVLISHFASSELSGKDRSSLLEKRRGAELSLIGQLDSSNPSVETVLSLQIEVGEIVGAFLDDDYSVLKMGAVIAAYPSGLFDVQLYCGTVERNVERTKLRKIREELRFGTTLTTRQIEYKTVEQCLQPVGFGSFENVDMLKELCDAGAPLDATLLHLVRHGSKMEDFLASKLGVSADDNAMQLSSAGEGPPPLGGIDLTLDSDATLKKLQEINADSFDKIEPELSKMLATPTKPSSLDSSVAESLKSLASVDMLLSALFTSGLNMSQFSLSLLSFDTLDKAESKLKEIKSLLDSYELDDYDEVASSSKFRDVADLTKGFYDLIPVHDEIGTPFEVNDHRFEEAIHLVCSLRDVAVIKQLLLGALHRRNEISPVDYCYRAIQMGMEPIEPFSRDRDIVERYIDSTCTDDVVVNEIFALDNGSTIPSEIGNKRLLFLGAENENVLSILKDGPRIAPSEATMTGFEFGKGIYLTDKFSKALGRSSEMSDEDGQKQPRAYVFIAEVAIGNPYVAWEATYMESPKAGTHSTFVPGQSHPDPSLDLILESSGAMVPLGRLKDSTLAEFEWVTAEEHGGKITPEMSLEIERVRTDPSTQFPARVRIRLSGQRREKDALIESPLSDIVSLVPVDKANRGKRGDKVGGEHANNSEDGDKMIIDGEGDSKEIQPEVNDVIDETIQDMFGDDSSDDSDDEGIPSSNATKGKDDKSATLIRKSKKPVSADNEFIVYDTKQIKLKYLIEVTTPDSVKKKLLKE